MIDILNHWNFGPNVLLNFLQASNSIFIIEGEWWVVGGGGGRGGWSGGGYIQTNKQANNSTAAGKVGPKRENPATRDEHTHAHC